MQNLKKIEAILASENVKVCPHCRRTKQFPTDCTECRGMGFIKSDGSALTKQEVEFLGQVGADVETMLRQQRKKM